MSASTHTVNDTLNSIRTFLANLDQEQTDTFLKLTKYLPRPDANIVHATNYSQHSICLKTKEDNYWTRFVSIEKGRSKVFLGESMFWFRSDWVNSQQRPTGDTDIIAIYLKEFLVDGRFS